jgi:hypothetical protein
MYQNLNLPKLIKTGANWPDHYCIFALHSTLERIATEKQVVISSLLLNSHYIFHRALLHAIHGQGSLN